MYLKLESGNTDRSNVWVYLNTKNIIYVEFKFKRIWIKVKHKTIPMIFLSTVHNRNEFKKIDVTLQEKTYGE